MAAGLRKAVASDQVYVANGPPNYVFADYVGVALASPDAKELCALGRTLGRPVYKPVRRSKFDEIEYLVRIFSHDEIIAITGPRRARDPPSRVIIT